jgi:hypothetical protein
MTSGRPHWPGLWCIFCITTLSSCCIVSVNAEGDLLQRSAASLVAVNMYALRDRINTALRTLFVFFAERVPPLARSDGDTTALQPPTWDVPTVAFLGVTGNDADASTGALSLHLVGGHCNETAGLKGFVMEQGVNQWLRYSYSCGESYSGRVTSASVWNPTTAATSLESLVWHRNCTHVQQPRPVIATYYTTCVQLLPIRAGKLSAKC